MTKFRRQFDGQRKVPQLGNKWPKSVVRPDLGLTVRQLMDRHTRYPDDLFIREGNYTGDEEIPMDLDISEVKDLKDNLIENDKKVKKALADKKAEEIRQKRQKEIDKEVEKRLNEKKKPDNPEQ